MELMTMTNGNILVGKLGESAIICDGCCQKAWGIAVRPRIQLSDNEDDIVWLADDELPEAPADPGTTEGDYGKPFAHSSEANARGMNKWCARQCERSEAFYPGMGATGDPVPVLPDWSKRVFNIPRKE